MSKVGFKEKMIRVKQLSDSALAFERPIKFILCGTTSGIVELLANQDIPQAPLPSKLLLMSILLPCMMNSIV